MQKILILLFISISISACMQSTSSRSGKVTTARTNVTIDATRWNITDYRGLVALQCKPSKCRNFERIVFLPTINSGEPHSLLVEGSLDQIQAKRLVARLVPEPVKVKSASVRKSGKNFVINANFDTGYSGGTLRNVGRIVIESKKYYGVVGVSPNRGTSRRLMNTGFSYRN